MAKKTAADKIVAYAKTRKTNPTAPEIARGSGVNFNTVRRILGAGVSLDTKRKCNVTGTRRHTYDLEDMQTTFWLI